MPMLPVFMKWHHVFWKLTYLPCLLYIHKYLFIVLCFAQSKYRVCCFVFPKLLLPFFFYLYRPWTVTISIFQLCQWFTSGIYKKMFYPDRRYEGGLLGLCCLLFSWAGNWIFPSVPAMQQKWIKMTSNWICWYFLWLHAITNYCMILLFEGWQAA